MSERFRNVLALLGAEPWALEEAKLRSLIDLIALRARGEHLLPAEIQARTADGAGSGRTVRRIGPIAVIPIYGVIAQRMNLMVDVSGGTSTQIAQGWLRDAVADRSVEAIVLDFDSPGGSIYGVEEFAREIYAVRSVKPVVAAVNSCAASAAYWLASQATEIAVTLNGVVGAIGVYMVHVDLSRAYDREGIRHVVVSAGRFKAEGVPNSTLTPEAIEALQKLVDVPYGSFVDAVARGRGVSSARVRDGFGQGRIVPADQAVKERMADRVATLDQVVARLQDASVRRSLAASAPGSRAALNARLADLAGTRAGAASDEALRLEVELMRLSAR